MNNERFIETYNELQCINEYISKCPATNISDIDNILDDGDVYVVTVSMAIDKEDFEALYLNVNLENGEYSEEYLNYLKGKVKPNGEYLESRIKAYAIDNGYDSKTIYAMLDNEFKGTNWREILEIYLSAKGGSL